MIRKSPLAWEFCTAFRKQPIQRGLLIDMPYFTAEKLQ